MDLLDKKLELLTVKSELIYNESLRLQNYAMLHFEKDKKKRDELLILSVMLNMQMAMLKANYNHILSKPIKPKDIKLYTPAKEYFKVDNEYLEKQFNKFK